MATANGHWKLGLFVLIGAVLGTSTLGLLGALSMHRDVGRYVSYFDESVQGLEVGSPIKFRGVTIGAVSKVDVAPDHRHVEVTSELGKAVLTRLGLDVAAGPVDTAVAKKLEQAIDLRAQLASAGITGVKFLQLDFFAVADHPRPELPFPVPKNYIPATSSTMKDLEDSVVRTMNSLPEIVAHLMLILDGVDRLVGELHAKVAEVQPAQVVRQVEQTLVALRETAGHVNALLARLDADQGLLDNAAGAAAALADAARTTDSLGNQLEGTLRSVDAAARSIRKLTGAIEQEPDMLVKGRTPESQ